MYKIGNIPEEELIKAVLSDQITQSFVHIVHLFVKNVNVLDAQITDDHFELKIDRWVPGSILTKNNMNHVEFSLSCHSAKESIFNFIENSFNISNTSIKVLNDECLGQHAIFLHTTQSPFTNLKCCVPIGQQLNENSELLAVQYAIRKASHKKIWDHLDERIQVAIDREIQKDHTAYIAKAFGKHSAPPNNT